MSDSCRAVEEAIASGEALSPRADEHIASCEACEKMRMLSSSLSSALGTTAQAPMPLGLAPRLSVRAGQRLAQGPLSRARFIALGASVLAAAALVLLLRGDSEPGKSAVQGTSVDFPSASETRSHVSEAAALPSSSEIDLLQVVLLSDVEASLSDSADWDRYLGPISATELLTRESGQ